MYIDEWERRYYSEPDRLKRKELLDEREAIEGPSDELSFLRKLHEHRYTPERKEPDSVDHMLRGVLYLKHAGGRSGFFKKPPKKEILSICEDLGLGLDTGNVPNADQIFYREYKHLGKTYFSLCCSDRGYTSFIWGLGTLSDATLRNKLSHDAETIAHEVPAAIGLEEKLKTFSQAFTDAFFESVNTRTTVSF